MPHSRAATPADAPTLALHRYPEPKDAPEREIYAAWVAGAIERGLYLGWLAEAGGAVIAGAGLTLLEWGPSRGDPQPLRARLVNVWTHPDWRKQGHATALIERCIQAAQERGLRHISLGSSEMARHLYLGRGFKVTDNEMRLTLPH